MRHRSSNDLQKAGRYTCRHDGVASILDFKLKLANRCSKEVKTGAIHASILDFRPRLANRCSKEVKSGANRAAILDFRPRLANRCSAEVKTGIIPAAQGRSIMPRQGNAGWAGTSDGVAARGFVNVRGPPRSGGRESTAGAHRSEVPASRQTRTRKDGPARRQTRPREPTAADTKKRVPTHR